MIFNIEEVKGSRVRLSIASEVKKYAMKHFRSHVIAGIRH